MTSSSGLADGLSAPSTANRVPAPGATFWVVKVVTTGMGETISDFLVKTFAPELVVPAAFVVLLTALVLQLRVGKYRPATYWTTALMVSIFGTMAADALHVALGVPYAVASAGFSALLAVLFIIWWIVERDLSVHDVTTIRRERFYWATVITTFALGTALGDFTASSLKLGYLTSSALFLVVFVAPGIVFAVTRRAAVATFWVSYVMTRPLGASFADWLAVPPARGGIGFGSGAVSAVLLLLFFVLVGVLVRTSTTTRAKRSTELEPPLR